MDEATRLRDKCGSFRILVMGRANAGKTTILQAVCGTTERPDVYDPRGRKIRAGDLVLIPNTGRGGQNIENEIRFPSNPGFVFHDSSGFESGSTEELGLVRAFINHRAAERTLKGQLHAIWFCLPMDNDARMLTTAELEFFHRCDTGKVPVIAIFTKFDSLDAKAFIELFEGGVPFGDAQDRAPYYAEKRFDQIHLPRIRAQKYPPAKEVRFRNMHENGSTSKVGQENIADLLKKTTDALTTDVLKLLLVSVQQNNVELCMENAVKSGSITKAAQRAHNTSKPPSQDQLRQLLKEIFAWFPYAWAPLDDDFMPSSGFLSCCHSGHPSSHADELSCLDMLLGVCPISNESPPTALQILNLGAAVIIVAGNIFWLQSGRATTHDFRASLGRYHRSVAERVREAVWDRFKNENGHYDTLQCINALHQIVLDNQIRPGQMS